MNRKVHGVLKNTVHALGFDVGRFRAPRPQSNVLALTISDVLLRLVLSGGTLGDFQFVQVGANDGLTSDPIRRFVVKYGFRGLLVEPQPDVFERLRMNYAGMSGLLFENAAIAASDGITSLYRFRRGGAQPDWADGLASFSRETLVNNNHNVKGDVEEIRVATVTFSTLLARHSLGHVDLLQIDAEGFDYELIKTINLRSFRPTIIHFEHSLLPFAVKHECFAYLSRNGYKITGNGPDTVAYIEPPEQALFDTAQQAT